MEQDLNVIILASDLKNNSLSIGKVPNIIRTVRILNLYGFKQAQIFIVGPKSNFIDENLEDFVNFIDCEFSQKFRSAVPFLYAMDKIKNSNVLIINSDLVIETNDLDQLIDHNIEAGIFVRRVKTISDVGLYIGYDNNKLTVTEDNSKLDYPYYIYQGLSLIKNCNINPQIEDSNVALLELIVNQFTNIQLIDYCKEIDGVKAAGYRTRDLKGGSYASLQKRLLIRKDAEGEGIQKLVDEIKWLENLDDDIAYKFPKVIDSYISNNYAWFDMPFYDLPNLRKCLLSGYFNESEFKVYIGKILNFVFSDVYNKEFGSPSANWMFEKHYDRVYTRLDQIEQRSDIFSELHKHEFVYINDTKYRNLRSVIQDIESSKLINNAVTPTCLYRIHGDLHFQNMLVDNSNSDFILADPRGEMDGSDVFYDMGKLWHSVNGLYDLIHTDISQATLNISNDAIISIDYGSSDLINMYSKLKEVLLDELKKHDLFNNDKHAMMKMEFNEVMHFSSVMPFHLMDDGVENRALCLYCSSVIIANEFYENYLEGK